MASFPLRPESQDPRARIGKVVRSNGDLHHVSAVQKPGGSNKLITINVDATVGNDALYSGNVKYLDIQADWSFTTDGSGTAAELAAGILQSLNNSVNLGILAYTPYIEAGAIKIPLKEGIDAVVNFVDNPNTDLSVAYTAAVAATQFRFGRFVEITDQRVENNIVVDVAEGVDASSVVANVALVLDSDEDATFDALMTPSVPVGPRPDKIMTLARPNSGKTQYGVEAPAGDVTWGGAVHIERSAGANNGKPLTASSGTSFLLTTAKWVGKDEVDPSVAILEM